MTAKEFQKYNKDWTPGSGATDDEWSKHKKVSVEHDTEDPFKNYKLFISGVVPRPVGFIATIDKDGNNNIAPYSAFNFVSTNPPIFVIGASPSALRDGAKKDTLANALLNGELTINIVSDWFIDAANYTAINSPEGVDEFELAGLHALPSKYVKVPHVAESAFSIEARVISTHNWTSKIDGKQSGTLIVAEGIHTWVREDVLNSDKSALELEKLRPVGRLGGLSYTTITDGYPLTRPLWDDEQENLKKK